MRMLPLNATFREKKRARILERTAKKAKENNIKIGVKKLTIIIEEAIQWARLEKNKMLPF